jgi:type I restriction enzyme, S subunit
MQTKKFKLSQLLTIKNGKDYKNESQGEIPVYGTGGIMSYVDKELYEGESILLPRKGSLDNIMYVNGKFWTIDTIYWTIINNDLVYPKYLFSYLKLLKMSKRNTGSTLPSMTFDTYYTLEVNLPDMEQQKKIGNCLFNLVEKIEINNMLIDKLEDMAKTIYDYWFLQFEFPSKNGLPYYSSGGSMTWNDEYKKMIPTNWNVKKLSDCVSKEKYAIVDGPFGTQLKIGEYVSDGIPVYEMEQLNNLFIIDEPRHFITVDKYNEIKRSSVKNGDIIISKTGTLGLLGIINTNNYENGIIVSRLAKITPDSKKIGKYALLIMLKEVSDSGYWNKISNGSTMPILNNDLISNLAILYPNDELYIKYENLVSPYFKKIFYLQSENCKLKDLKEKISPLLINGQIILNN